MGYTTDFDGVLTFDKPLTAAQVKYIQDFNNSRRMKRDAAKAALLTDKVREAVGLPIGEDAAYYVGSAEDGQMGQKNDNSVLDYNSPAGQLGYDDAGFSDRWAENKKRITDGKCQPSLWCQWTVNDEGTQLEWDGGEKFYYYTEWLKYLIAHFFNVWGVKLNGEIKWTGEDDEDMGKIYVTDSVVEARKATITY